MTYTVRTKPRAKRRLYKPERAPARIKGGLAKQAPNGCLDATPHEIALALFAICEQAGAKIGRSGEYDPLRDKYTVTGKSLATGKAQDFTVEGVEVANAILLARALNGGRLDRPSAKAATR